MSYYNPNPDAALRLAIMLLGTVLTIAILSNIIL